MSKAVKEAYKKSGVSMRRAGITRGGKGIHTLRAHKAVIRYIKNKGLSASEAWKRVMGGMGKHAVRKEHQRTP